MLGECQVGKAWAAVDGQGRFAAVALLEGPAAADPRWREAFANAVYALAQAPDGLRYANVDFSSASPWAAYGPDAGNAPQRLFETLGQEYRPGPAVASSPVVASVPAPVSGVPTPAPASSPPAAPAASVSGVPSAGPDPAQPTSGPPQLPWAAQAWSMPAQQPVSGAPTSAPAAPTSAQPATSHDPFASSGRRIAPAPRERRRMPWLLVGVGALVLALLAGGGGFALGNAGGPEEGPVAAPSSSPSLAPYEATQFSINKAKFEGELAPLAEPWLARIGGCAADTDAGGPKLPADEKRHVFCRYGGVSLHFALYRAKAEKDAARAYRQQLNLAGGALAPGLREATRTTGGVSGAAGSYVEYALKGDDDRTICGLWWDRDDVDAAFYVETLCEAGIAGNWDALRDLWRRNS
ncbi:hypothetical protein [Micromonospora sp. CPCC 205561]|uniref:hypothetical protein n=1 Tax=Micromonospora sp. CPCC 205561 TaxID=3122407 RepID=UPI002FF0254A